MTDGFQKIELTASENKEGKTINTKEDKKRNPKIFNISLFIFFVFLIITILIIIFPGRNLYFSVQKTAKIAKEAYQAIKNQNIDLFKNKLIETEENLTQVNKQIKTIFWLSYLPFLGNYIQDAQHLITASLAGVQAAKLTADTLIPYSDLLGLKGKSTFVSGTADERIQLAVETLDKVMPNIDRIAEKITIMEQEITKIDVDRYPENIGSLTVKSKLKSGKEILLQSSSLFVEAKPLLLKIPDLLGINKPKKYLFLFQNDAELRATGGFITAYAVFSVDKGKLRVEKSDDIYKLDESKKKRFPAPEPILKYHQNVQYLELRDSNLSPDFVDSMKSFEKIIQESISDFPKYDGLIALDTHVLVSAIKILGEFNIYGRKFSADIDKRCDCPKAIYELEDYATKPVGYVREERKDIISILLFQIMQRALGVSPSKYWGNLIQVFVDEAAQKHILFYFHDENAQKGIESLNFAGRIVNFDGDYLHINDVNFAGAKSNLFIKKIITQDFDIQNDGIIVKTLTMNYKNPQPASNCNLEAGQLCLNGILRNWLRIYVPLGSKLIEFTGSEKKTVTYDELGKTVFEGFFTVKPLGSSDVIIKYQLPDKVKEGNLLKLFIQKQAGTDNQEFKISRKGKEIDKFNLYIDKNLQYKM